MNDTDEESRAVVEKLRLVKKSKKQVEDLMFDNVHLRTKPEDFEESESEQSEADLDNEDIFGLEDEIETGGPRRSKRLN